ncbi:YrhB domain-containing protein [Chryseobacterium sp. IT-36CA2]|uniref:YrhB domain-containing protein n=1 Tax=Chryseobacterium sp. IT-36CA2 TaxID=3026460 RepID=UPI0039DF82EB
MLSENEIMEVANNFLKDLEPKIGEPLIFPKELMIKKPYGIYFIYHSKKYLETKDWEEKLLGNAPFLVEKSTGKIIEFGTSRSMDEYIKEYEAGKYS